MHLSQALYNALLYSSDNSALDCDSSHGSSHFSKNACPYDPTGTTDFVPPTPPKLQGGFFNWTPPKLSKYKFLYNLWHLEKF